MHNAYREGTVGLPQDLKNYTADDDVELNDTIITAFAWVGVAVLAGLALLGAAAIYLSFGLAS